MSFDWHNPYPTVRSPVFARNVVSTSHPLASQAGLRMLLKGGNAIDAAIAAAAALNIVEQVSNGLGSDLFAIMWDGQRLLGLNASGVAPASWCPAYFERRHAGALPVRGWDSVTTPGAVAGWAALSERCGRLPFADEHRADGTRAKRLEHKQAESRGQVAGPAAGVDRGYLCRESHASSHRDIFQACPECVFETHAGLVTPDDHRSFDNGIFARGFRGAAIAALFALHE